MSLQGSPDGSLAVPLEWTDLAPPSVFEHLGIQPPILEAQRLLELVELVQQLKSKTKTGRHAKKDLTNERI